MFSKMLRACSERKRSKAFADIEFFYRQSDSTRASIIGSMDQSRQMRHIYHRALPIYTHSNSALPIEDMKYPMDCV